MSMLVVAPVIGVCLGLALTAVIVALRSASRADVAMKEAARISRASIAQLRKSTAGASAPSTATPSKSTPAPTADQQHALKQAQSAAAQRTLAERTRLYRAFLYQAATENGHLMRVGHTPVIGAADETLGQLRVESLLWGSPDVLRALRNFTRLRARRPRAAWPQAYTMAYARLEVELIAAMRRDLDPVSPPLSAEQIWGSISAGTTDPAFRLALISPLAEVLRNTGHDPRHYDLA